MILLKRLCLSILFLLGLAISSLAQSNETLTMSTVHRPPFAIVEGGEVSGFSVDLMRAIGLEIGREIVFVPQPSFGEMLERVTQGDVDGAIANISITTEREREMDFSQPIFASGIKVLLPNDDAGLGIFAALFTREIGLIVLSGLALLMCGGLLMWLFERRHQPYFDKSAKEAMFPSFWWALNLVVNGGFEERVPQSPFGRVFAVMLVIASLFIVSIFVASITAATTVSALNSNVQSLRDLQARSVGTITASTSATLLAERSLHFTGFDTPGDMFAAFEDGGVDALVFDGPILAYYHQTNGAGRSRLLDRSYRPESYGIAMPTGTPIKEEVDQVLLKLRVDGTYDRLLTKWFGNIYSPE